MTDECRRSVSPAEQRSPRHFAEAGRQHGAASLSLRGVFAETRGHQSQLFQISRPRNPPTSCYSSSGR